MNYVKINNWACIPSPRGSTSLYLAPELIGVALNGYVENHPSLGSGSVTTSCITEINGRYVKTANTWYKLGRISPKYRAYLRQTRPNWDWRNPITMIYGK